MDEDAHSQMLDLAVRLATKRAAGHHLTPAECVLSDITWIDTQVSPNGFDGWLFNTPSERIHDTMNALEIVDCPRVLELIRRALAVARVNPVSMSDEKREACLHAMSEDDRERLSELDAEFYLAVGECMKKCKAFADAHKADINA